MAQNTDNRQCRVGFFTSVPPADAAVRNLLAAGFTHDQLAVICPDKFKNQFDPDVRRAQRPGSHATEAMVEGGAIGAALGGVALVAASIATGGVGMLPAIPVLIGGGALAGGFSGLIVRDGYGEGVGEYYEEAIHEGKIAVGVDLEGDDSAARIAEAERILVAAGADLPAPRQK